MTISMKTAAWLKREFGDCRIVAVTPRGKANAANTRQAVHIESVTIKPRRVGRHVTPAGTKQAGTMRLNDEQLAAVLAAVAR